MNNQMTAKSLSAKQYFTQPAMQNKLDELLGERKTTFMTSVLQSVAGNAKLSIADPATIFMAACTSAALGLPINDSLGFAYIIPYEKSNGKDASGQWLPKTVEAQFQLGYKGYIQLAQRSGQFKTISTCEVYQGDTEQSIKDRLTLFLPELPPSNEVIGYVAYFRLLNGFEAHVTMRTQEIVKHATSYSQSYRSANGTAWKEKNSIWHQNFDAMAKKTVLKLLISKQAPMSIDSELSVAIQADQSVMRDVDGYVQYDYTDNQPEQAVVEMDISNNPQLFHDVKTSVQNGNLDKAQVLSGQTGYIISDQQRQELAAS